MSDLLKVSSNPHVRTAETTKSIMWDVVFALLPASAFGVFHFGIRAFWVILVTIASCVVSEMLYLKLMKKKVTCDGSAVVTGLLLALNLPVEIPYWIAILGGIFAIIIVKQLFGGLGQNFMNPALGARCFLLISFAGQMTNFTLDGVSTATPLALMRNDKIVNVTDMFIGNIAGTIGETCTIALILGGVYLIVKKIIDFRIPLAYLITFTMFMAAFSSRGLDRSYLIAQLSGGGIMLGAFFMATDYVTSPITHKGRILYGILLGILTGSFRLWGNSAEGVSYAIILGNLVVPLIDQISMPMGFGIKKVRKAGKKNE